MIEAIGRPILILLGVKVFGSSALAIVAGTAAATTVALVLLRYRSAQEARRLPAPSQAVGVDAGDHALADGIRRFTRPLLPAFLIIWIVSLSDRYIIQGIVKDTTAVGIYAAGYGLISQPFIMAHSVLSLTLRPIYFKATSHNDFAHARRTFATWLLAAIAICGIGVVLATILCRPVVGLFLDHRYGQTAQMVPWIAAGYLFYVVQQTLEQNLLAYKRTGAVLVEGAFGAIISIVVTVPLVRAFGARRCIRLSGILRGAMRPDGNFYPRSQTC